MLIGAHVSTAGGLVRALERAEERGAESMQIFNQSPRVWRPTKYTEADFAAFRERLARSPVESVYIHAVYLINVASDDAEVRRKSLESLTHALTVGDGIGARRRDRPSGQRQGPGAGADVQADRQGVRRRAGARPSAARCLFENTAGAGFTIGRTFEELARVIEGRAASERLGVCLDSCHLLRVRPRGA